MRRKNVVILGSTGSIGVNTLKIIERFPERFKVLGLTAYNNSRLLAKQVRRFVPKYVAVQDKGRAFLETAVDPRKTRILNVAEDLEVLVAFKSVDIVVIAMRGSAALGPFLSAVRAGKTVAPANKEALVVAGDLIMREAKRYAARIIPIDSEQSAIFQCLQGQNRGTLKKVYLTASGGPLLNVPVKDFAKISVDQILAHPRWRMGAKITVDSAMLMNKGFEVIEAMRLFQLNVEDIQVLIHPEAIIHSMVEFQDASVIAQLGVPDMRLPIQYALTYPDRWPSGLPSVNFFQLGSLTFQRPDVKKFPALGLAVEAGRRGGTVPAVLNAADEEAVEAFLKHKITFPDIYRVVEKVLRKHTMHKSPDISRILRADQWAREEARRIMDA